MLSVSLNLRFLYNTVYSSEPYTKYSVWVKAFTWKHEGNSSDTIEVLTDVSGPGR